MLRAVALLCCAVFLGSPSAPAQVAASSGESVEARSKALSEIFSDVWQDRLKHNPEYASTLGDKRYNDQLSDYSAAEVNRIARTGAALLRAAVAFTD